MPFQLLKKTTSHWILTKATQAPSVCAIALVLPAAAYTAAEASYEKEAKTQGCSYTALILSGFLKRANDQFYISDSELCSKACS